MDIVRALVESRPDFFANRYADLADPIRINEFIWQSSGLSNAYLLVTPAGRIVINTGMGFEALTHKRLFDSVSTGPTPYIVLTQGHVDHVGGVALFREPGPSALPARRSAHQARPRGTGGDLVRAGFRRDGAACTDCRRAAEAGCPSGGRDLRRGARR